MLQISINDQKKKKKFVSKLSNDIIMLLHAILLLFCTVILPHVALCNSNSKGSLKGGARNLR